MIKYVNIWLMNLNLDERKFNDFEEKLDFLKVI